MKTPHAHRTWPAVAVFAAATLAACSTSPSATAEDDAGTVAFSWGDYETQLPSEPERVVVLDSRAALDFAIIADFPIVATNWDDGSVLPPMLPDHVEAFEWSNTEPDMEAIVNADPDMLVVSAGWFDWYRERDQIDFDLIPTFVVDQGSPTSQWRDAMAAQLSSIGREQEAEQIERRYEEAIAVAAEQIGDLLDGKVIAIAGAYGGDYWLQGDTFSVSVAEDLGLTVLRDDPDTIDDGTWTYSAENLDVFSEADLIIVQNIDAPETAAAAWQRIPAIEAGHVAELPYYHVNGLALTAIDLAHHLAEAAQLLAD
ncbi:ABC transporter substrate-binding protein [Bogoriella caseilytica]|uniref:Iron complex transport system substrate-binding protein n=1 Tax=Bogoriella caseilytica TaxID=56055 RepID=A0A3N2BDU7_9MICO|nr:ABC transporter substrate-binding protein [Bogoriella caseilytica]ROR73421.1 iron complex transport system substrate-binding protein [Bogoriella caseilytica]